MTWHPVFSLCGMSPAAQYIELSSGVVAIESHATASVDSMLLISFFGRQQLARVCGPSLITEDGEAIEGDALDDVAVIGVVAHIIRAAGLDGNPVM